VNNVHRGSESERGGISNESIEWALGAGTYYILVRAHDSAGTTTIDYNLSYSSQLTSTRDPKSETTPGGNSQPLWHDDVASAPSSLRPDNSKRYEGASGVLAV